MQGLRNFVHGAKFIFLSFARLAKFRTGCEIHFVQLWSVLQLVLLLGISRALRKFRIAMRNCWMLDFFSDSLPCILAKATKLSKTWILHVFELYLAFPLIIHNFPSLLACFNDQKAIKNTKTCQKLISNTCMGP